MQAHMTAPAPGGHAHTAADMAAMTAAQMKAEHNADHAKMPQAGHSHQGGMNAAQMPRQEQRTIVERRFVDFTDGEVREASDGSALFTGYAAVFNQWADIGGHFRERIIPGAFKRTINNGTDVPFLFNHNADTVMARTSNGKLRLAEDDHGLHVEADLNPADRDAAALITKIRDKNVSKMSFAFSVPKNGDSWNREAAVPERDIREARLYDTSSVTSPAYEGTSGGLRAEARSIMEAAGIAVPDEATEELAEALRALTQAPPELWAEIDPETLRGTIDTLTRFVTDSATPKEGEPASSPDPTDPAHSLDRDLAARRLGITRNRLRLLGVAV